MAERIFDTPVTVHHDSSMGTTILFLHCIGYFARGIAEFIRISARDERIVAVVARPIRYGRHSIAKTALRVSAGILLGIERRLTVEVGVFDVVQPNHRFVEVVIGAVPFLRGCVSIASVGSEIGSRNSRCRASEQGAV